MGVTYTTASDRERRRSRLWSGDVRGELLLCCAAIVAILMIAIGYAGRAYALSSVETSRGAVTTINLNAVASAAELEPALSMAFANSADRRLVARELFASIAANGNRAQLANVGALSRIVVATTAIERLPSGSSLAARWQTVRDAAVAGGRTTPVGLPLLTAADVSAIKPGLVVRTGDDYRRAVLWSAIALIASFAGVSLWWQYSRVRGDRVLLSAALLLTTLGFIVVLSRPDPLRDTVLVVRYTQGVVLGLILFAAASMVNIRRASHLGFSYLPLLAALVLSVALIVFGTGPGTSGARINFGPVQPIEGIRLLLVLFLAGYFARRWEVLRQLRGTTIRRRPLPAWLNAPRLDHALPVLAGVAIALVLFFALKDLGPALLLSLIFLAMFAVARAGVGMAAIGIAVLAVGFYLGHKFGISSTLAERVAMWQSPWENAVRGGDQIAQAIWAMATGAFAGSGAGLGSTRYLPAGHTDLVLASVAEELGVTGVAVAIAAFAVIAWRGLRISRTTSTDYGFFVALGMTLSLVIPLLVMAGGVLGVMPLTGVVTPFLSYGGSAMAANFVALGLLVSCRADARALADTMEPFRVPLRWVGSTLAAIGVVLLIVWVRVQVVSADEFMVKPQLSQQADGGLRFQYNPRVIDVAQLMPRGNVFDRSGLPLASADAAVISTARAAYKRIGADSAATCSSVGERCYPLGGETFHLMGDATTRANWSASNSSYVERDAESRLRGFDDHALVVRTKLPGYEDRVAVRRDYAALVPLVRHRWEPQHSEVVDLLERPRDLELTIDARLQHQVAAILQRAAADAGVSRAAAVVLDAATGEVLASVSYPWPGSRRLDASKEDAMFDRARYGLYPPGSTFKLVTAAAALRLDPGLVDMSMLCSRLSGNRVGVRIAGWGRPIRDDVHDHEPHGAIGMHDGMVRSCNAYFAQLAVHLGPEALASTAGLAGIALSPSNAPAVLRENLPHAGYGQGQVVTTPLRMARVVAAIASDGVIREASVVQQSGPALATRFTSEDGARTLGGYMRDAVTEGTGRQLARHPLRIAGKTGTAEVDDAASHAWFVGYAPHGPASRRIAFAVILENAGYGGASAAAASGQIVTAAGALGLVR